MAAISGEEAEVPPMPTHPLGLPVHGTPPLAASEKQMMMKCPQSPFAANRETSGTSRTESAGLPKIPDCHEGLAYPAQVVFSVNRKLAFPAPLAQLLGPPLPPMVLRKSAPAELLQNPFAPVAVVKPSTSYSRKPAQESFQGISGM